MRRASAHRLAILCAGGETVALTASGNHPVTTALIPVYNERTTVIGVLAEIGAWVDQTVVVDDGSTDGSTGLLDAWATAGAGRVVLHHPRNRGMSKGLLTGFSYLMTQLDEGRLARDDVLVMLDADGQHLPSEIPLLVRRLSEGPFDVVLGRRDLSRYPFGKRFGNRCLSWWASRLGGQPYTDAESGFRVMRLWTVERLLPYFTALAYGCAQEIAVLTARQGARVDNSQPVTIRFYRKGVRHRDGITNAVMALVAFGRSLTRPRLDARQRARLALAGVSVVGGGPGER